MGAQELMVQFVSDRVPKSALWFAAGVGRHQRRVTETALRLGGHVRLGLADNIYLRRGVLAEGTATFIERSAAFAVSIGRQPVSPERARVLLGLVAEEIEPREPDAPEIAEETVSEAAEVASVEPPPETPEGTAGDSD
jgi:3-keto-5-aminohexanoate cleavage enzyme